MPRRLSSLFVFSLAGVFCGFVAPLRTAQSQTLAGGGIDTTWIRYGALGALRQVIVLVDFDYASLEAGPRFQAVKSAAEGILRDGGFDVLQFPNVKSPDSLSSVTLHLVSAGTASAAFVEVELPGAPVRTYGVYQQVGILLPLHATSGASHVTRAVALLLEDVRRVRHLAHTYRRSASP